MSETAVGRQCRAVVDSHQRFIRPLAPWSRRNMARARHGELIGVEQPGRIRIETRHIARHSELDDFSFNILADQNQQWVSVPYRRRPFPDAVILR